MSSSNGSDPSNRGVLHRILYGADDDRIRASWRILVPLVIAVLLYFLAYLLPEIVVSEFVEADTDGQTEIAIATVFFVTMTLLIGLSALVGLFVASRLDRRPVASYGFERSLRWAREFVVGVVIGAIASIGAVGYQVLRGYTTVSVDVTGVGAESALLGGVVLIVLLLFVLANNVFEELLFRAIVIRNAANGLRCRSFGVVSAVTAAVAVSLPLFGLVHLLGGGLEAVVTSAIAGILFATAYVLTGRLALPIGVHFGGIVLASIVQEPLSREPELTLPSLVTAENAADPSLLVSVETWTARMVIGVACLCLWVYLSTGTISISERVYS